MTIASPTSLCETRGVVTRTSSSSGPRSLARRSLRIAVFVAQRDSLSPVCERVTRGR